MDEGQYLIALDAFREALTIAGSQSAFERMTGAKQQTVSYWLKHRKVLGGEFVLRTEAGTGIPRSRLRPDLYPTEHDFSSQARSVAPDAPIAACDRGVLSHSEKRNA